MKNYPTPTDREVDEQSTAEHREDLVETLAREIRPEAFDMTSESWTYASDEEARATASEAIDEAEASIIAYGAGKLLQMIRNADPDDDVLPDTTETQILEDYLARIAGGGAEL